MAVANNQKEVVGYGKAEVMQIMAHVYKISNIVEEIKAEIEHWDKKIKESLK